MEPKKVIHYEDNAEQRTVTGWVCKTCGRWYGYDDDAKRMASYCCCTDRPCECGGRAEKHYVKCKSCRDRIDTEKYFALEEFEWDGTSYLVGDDSDWWFYSVEDILEYLDKAAPTDDDIEGLRLLNCVENHPPRGYFDITEYLQDFLAEDCDPPGDWEAAEKVVNDYLEANRPLSWKAGNKRPSTASIQRAIAGYHNA
jgi:hypothetical protein